MTKHPQKEPEMSIGTTKVVVRIGDDVLSAITDACERSRDTLDDPHTLSSWIRMAIREKLNHAVRGRIAREVKKGQKMCCYCGKPRGKGYETATYQSHDGKDVVSYVCRACQGPDAETTL